MDSLREHFGIGQVVWPEAQLADAIERIIMAPGAIDAGVFAGGRIQLLEFRLDEHSSLVHHPILSLDLPSGVVIVAVKREDSISIPRGRTQLSSGDKVVLMGTREAMDQLRHQVSPGAGQAGSQLVTIIGGGDVGYRLAQHFDQAEGFQLRIIERNLLACLLGRQLGVRKVITRVSKTANLRLFERVGIDVALSARGAAVTSVVHQIDGGRASLLAVLEEGQAKVVELLVPEALPTTLLKDLGLPQDSIVGTVLREGEALVPSGEDRIFWGDRLLVCCTDAAVHQVRDMFASVPS